VNSPIEVTNWTRFDPRSDARGFQWVLRGFVGKSSINFAPPASMILSMILKAVCLPCFFGGFGFGHSLPLRCEFESDDEELTSINVGFPIVKSGFAYRP
jgi:hypothetical protein